MKGDLKNGAITYVKERRPLTWQDKDRLRRTSSAQKF